MCSKPSDVPAPVARAHRKVWSITRRLTLLYAVSTALLLLLSSGYLYWTLRRGLEQTRHGLLASKIEVLRGLLREQPGQIEVLANEVEHEASESQPLKYYIRVLDESGRVLLETPGMSTQVAVGEFAPPVELGEDLRRGLERQLRHRGTLLLLSARAAVGADGRSHRTLQIAMDAATGNQFLTDYGNRLLAMLGVGLVLAAIAGGWVARHGMRPLAEITAAAQHVTASQLHQRIAAKPWPAELVQLAAAFDGMLDRLEDSFTRLAQFSADLAHALRTPIHNLRGEAEVALARARSPEEYQHVLASGLEECERLSRMIDGLLFLARADDPNAALKRICFEARAEMEAVREFYDALASEQQITVHCDGAATLTGDPMLFRRAVSNLLGNALRHTPMGGSVSMSVAAAEGRVLVTVRDTGCGIPPEHRAKIFDRFYRAGESTSPVPGGIGLGLAIVKSIMRLHGGSVSVHSEVGKGSTFTLDFPSAR